MTEASAATLPQVEDPFTTEIPRWPGTPFAARTQQLNHNQMWMQWGGKMITDVFSDLDRELHAVRNRAAMGDMSPLSKYDVVGPGAADALDHILTRDVHKLAVGQTYYTPWCNQDGKLVADGLVIRVDDQTFRISADPNLAWLTEHCAPFDAEVSDVTDVYAIMSLQGPRSTEVLAAATGQSWDDLRFSRLAKAQIAGRDIDLLRQGFTGEVGYELWIHSADAVAVWDAVAAAGEPFGIEAAGAAVEDIARVEAGLFIVGYDYNAAGTDAQGASVQLASHNDASPFELGLGKFVDFSKKDFIGRAALEREAAVGGRTTLVGLEIDWVALTDACASLGLAMLDLGRVRWNPIPLAGPGHPNRRATSVTWSRTARKLVGFGHVSPDDAAAGTVDLLWPIGEEAVTVSAKIVSTPFVSRKRSKALS